MHTRGCGCVPFPFLRLTGILATLFLFLDASRVLSSASIELAVPHPFCSLPSLDGRKTGERRMSIISVRVREESKSENKSEEDARGMEEGVL